jgi:hypothetical protein
MFNLDWSNATKDFHKGSCLILWWTLRTHDLSILGCRFESWRHLKTRWKRWTTWWQKNNKNNKDCQTGQVKQKNKLKQKLFELNPFELIGRQQFLSNNVCACNLCNKRARQTYQVRYFEVKVKDYYNCQYSVLWK